MGREQVQPPGDVLSEGLHEGGVVYTSLVKMRQKDDRWINRREYLTQHLGVSQSTPTYSKSNPIPMPPIPSNTIYTPYTPYIHPHIHPSHTPSLTRGHCVTILRSSAWAPSSSTGGTDEEKDAEDDDIADIADVA